MKRKVFTMATILAVAAMMMWGLSAPNALGQKAAAKSGYVAKGKRLFVQYCASCHGTDGKGQGTAGIRSTAEQPVACAANCK